MIFYYFGRFYLFYSLFIHNFAFSIPRITINNLNIDEKTIFTNQPLPCYDSAYKCAN